MNDIKFGTEAAGPTKLRKGFYGRKCLETGRIVDRRPMPPRHVVPPAIPNFEALEAVLGEHGAIACFGAEAFAIEDWVKATDGMKCRHSVTLVSGCAKLLREKAFSDTGLRTPTGAVALCILDRLAPDLQEEARVVLSEAREDWKAAGAPGPSYGRLKRAFKFFRDAKRVTDKINAARAESQA